ncbi:AraC family transcriptional regulator [Trinickia dabaoshanensis]|uniref:AraC family transcriptional regulator n=1 Tax=Trinickia dabaoshanensis TaxID=564714 RepID=A0A2N7VQB9_9BURK|nr:AraC family transcriptional regulator [Trinickia dabaoshanensis]PMS19354.1 AraC family transcriptional regulator [Trinickia dabaoshanensis]
MAKIALELEHALARRAREATKGATASRVVASGEGFSVSDVLCTCGPRDAAFEERHGEFCIALVAAGAFEYRCSTGHALMTPGAVLLGNAGECFECAHRHRAGDRCIAFHYRPEFFERLFADAGHAGRSPSFASARIAPARALASFVAAAGAAVSASSAADIAWDEMALSLAASVLRQADGAAPSGAKPVSRAALARVVDTLQWIDGEPDAALGVEHLAKQAGLSPYHFLRTFERATGVTPHQYILRARLRVAAQRLADAPDKVVDVALACGFADLSNFNRAFRAEFGVAPRAYRNRFRR